jgi:polysaccharide pyruvyl transferase WcaK-like protein
MHEARDKESLILMTGMFDMHNFGDLLFPLLAEAKLAPLGFKIVPVSATGVRPRLNDAAQSLSLAEAFGRAEPAAGVLIGGGYILHTHRLDILREYRAGDTGAWVGAANWLGAGLLAAVHDAPIAWNAPGAPHPLSKIAEGLAPALIKASDYVSVRDRGSQKVLTPGSDAAEIVPDTLVDLPYLWPMSILAKPYAQLRAKLEISNDQKILAVHARGRSFSEMPLAELAKKIEARCRTYGLTPVFIGLGSAHNDDSIAQALHKAMTIPSACLSAPQSLQQIAALLAHCDAYIGSSLHGYIAAYSYGRPAVLVGRPSYQKFRGFLNHVNRDVDLAKNWDDGLAKLSCATVPPALPQTARDALDNHWQNIAQSFRRGPEAKRAERANFLRACFASGCHHAGAAWPCMPFTHARDLNAAALGNDVRGKDPI